MTKAEIVEQIYERVGFSKKEAAELVEKVFDIIKDTLADGEKVKITIRFRGCEVAHQDLGMKVLDRVREDLDEMAKVEQSPLKEGRMMTMVIAPR